MQISRSSNNYKTTDFSSLLNIILHFLIHIKTAVWWNIHVVLTSDAKRVCKIKTKQNKNKIKGKKQAETQIKASYSTAHEKQNIHLSAARGTYFYPLLIPFPILLLAQRSLCWGENLRGSLHLTRGKWSLGTSDLSYEPISEWKVFDIKAIHVKPLCEHNIRETFILESSGN